jgi:Holliday junction resolvase RusA-like endonuclease
MSCNHLILRFPMPPSVNKLYKNIGRGRAKTKEYDKWLKDRLWELSHIAKSHHIKGSVKLHYDFLLGTSFRGDVCNRIKATEDALVKAGIIEDDNHRIVTGGSFTISYHLLKDSYVEVTINRLQEEMEL